MRIVLFWFLFTAWIPISFAQEIRVIDLETNEPLEWVAVSNLRAKVLVNTDELGKADISAFSGMERIQFQRFGYETLFLSFAQIQESDFLVQLKPSYIGLEQAVVTASKWSQSRSEVPAKIISISKEERQLLNPQTAADLLGISGEVFIQKSQLGGGSPMIRGFSTNRLLYTVDGVRMNTAIFRSGNLQNVISLDPMAMEGTEVFFGPGSIIYGSDAIGAVMGFQTLTPKLSTDGNFNIEGNVTLRGNTANKERTGHAHLIYGGSKWAGVTSFSRFRYDDQRMGSRGPEEFLRPVFVERIAGQDVLSENPNPRIQIPSGYDQTNFMQKIRFTPNRIWDFTYAYHQSETSDIPRFDRHIRFRPNGEPRSAEWFYGPQIWKMHHLNVKNKKATRIYDEVALNMAYQRFEESRIDRNFNDPIRRDRREIVDAYSVNLDFYKDLPKSSKLFYGAEYVLNQVTSTGIQEDINTGEISKAPSRYPNANWNSYAAYLTYQRKISDKSLVQTGVRYNRFGLDADFSNNQEFFPLPFDSSSNNEGAFNASAGWVYHVGDSWVMNLTASTGFRAPNVDDIGKIFDSEPGTVMVPNPDLRAEYAYNLEGNVGKVINENILFDLTAYYTYLDRAIVRREATLDGQDSIIYDGELSRVLSLQNASFVEIIGLQVGVELKFLKNMSFISKLNIQKGTEVMEDGEKSPSRHAPPTFGVTRLEYARNNFRIQLFSEYSGGFSFEQLPLEERGKPELYAIDADGNPFSPSWATLNLKTLYNLNELIMISAGFENITDVRYRTYSSGIAAPGRNFILSLMMNF